MLPFSAAAELSVASPFTDNAVLQRDMPVPVWGSAEPGQTILVEFAGQTLDTVADADGEWRVELSPMPGSYQAQSMRISCQDSTTGESATAESLNFSNLLVGDVWICSGQSNMQLQLRAVPEVAALVPSAKHIRSFEVKHQVAMTEQSRLQGQWLEEVPNSAVAFSFAYFLEEASDAPVGIILAAWGSSSIEAWMPRDMTETVPHFKQMMAEFDADTETQDRINAILNGPQPWSRQDDVFLRRQSNILYNAMIHPLIPYACRGLVWYQGERNTQSMFGMVKEPWYSRNSGMLKYADTLKAWMLRYRQAWGQDQFHFLTVMLPGYYKPLSTGPRGDAEAPDTHSWAWMRESQLKSLDLPQTAVANTIDLGDIKNIHPKDKLPIGQRLALLARRDILGEAIEAEGPMLQKIELSGSQVTVHFTHAKKLSTTDGQAPRAFWLSDDSQQWVRAEAEIQGATVILSSSECLQPRYVRYAFAGKPSVNLVNEANLPAYPFRTDHFEPKE
jgi:sialate O-acetylesterase